MRPARAAAAAVVVVAVAAQARTAQIRPDRTRRMGGGAPKGGAAREDATAG